MAGTAWQAGKRRGPEVARPGVLGISRAIGGHSPQPSHLGKGSFSSHGGRRWGGRECMSLPLCSQPPFLGIPLSPRRDSRLAPQPLVTHPYTSCGSSHLSGYGLQGTELPRTPRSKICSSCVKHSSGGSSVFGATPFYQNTEFLLYNTHQDTIAERVLAQPPILCPGHTLRLLILGSQIGTKDSRVGCCSWLAGP